ncbi:DUF1194 domain-containing protein [Pseudoprimorskyibacter insulae]|uniref:VWFA domain-containing protein n=1 Tax=Pseudoprimorskyibacter insulae TaxID=1695997 RepID=A0A2R8AQ92_9RHOB|nr:DUF1194 domain-containing protein [Pseudoprimorskyibacter insulae]SPF78057.1 hypothetical protein PRI8871_00646 [Pseudoprimorskyibacter insulae]
MILRFAQTAALCALALPAHAACRQALAIGMDVSGSVDSTEYQLQLNGMANALQHPDVVAALLAGPDAPVRLSLFEWSGPGLQRVIAPWAEIATFEDLAALTQIIRQTPRLIGDPSTAIGAAMTYGVALLALQPDCPKRTLDLSGDGPSNTGPRPQDTRGQADANGITINGLVIGAPARRRNGPVQAGSEDLWSYYTAYVITGPEAFVEAAKGFDDFEAAMVRKLLRELQGPLFSALDQ